MAAGAVQSAGRRDSSVVALEGNAGTTLSGGMTAHFESMTGKSALAWRSLLSFFAPMLTSACLFPEPPSYRAPEQTPPFLWSPIPATTEVQFVETGDLFQISVNLRSEDAGEPLQAFLVLNYLGQGAATSVSGITISPGTAGEQRNISMPPWKIPLRPTTGVCEQLSLVVSHQSNFNGWRPIDDSDVFVLTWWLGINGNQQTLADCSASSGATP